MKGMSKWTRWACAGAALWGMSATALAAPAPQTPAAKPASVAQTAPVLPPNKTVATVNGEAITAAQLEPLLKQAGPIPAGMPEAQRRELYREAMAILIDDMLLTQFLKKHVTPASAEAVDKQMKELVEGLKQKKMTLADLCKESSMTETQIREDIARDLQWNGYVEKLVTEADLKTYYDGYKDFFDKVAVRASHIVRRVNVQTPVAEREAERKKLQEVRQQILAGKLDFAAAAKQHSQCPSANNGGDIGHFPRKFVVDEGFARVAFSMKVGEVSDVVETAFGMHLIKVTERKPGTPSDFNKIKGEVREFYTEDMRMNLLARLRKEARVDIHP
jgi:peptidyl-prolyl cis-trans isomerase C